jgi:hypothetical protein
MKKAILILFLAVSTLASAQVPGYQGKRFLLSYNLGVSSNLFQYIFNTNGMDQKSFNIFFNQSFEAEYVLDRRFSLEGEFSFLDNNVKYADIPIPLDIKSTSLGINCVFYPFNNNSLAPIGEFTKLKLYSKNYSATGPLSYDNGIGYAYYNVKTKGQTYGIGVAFGHHHLIKNRILLSGSLDMDLDIANIAPASQLNEIQVLAQSHFLSTYIVYLKFGIGGLLF